METTTTTKNLGGKFLTFRLAGEDYGLQILMVQEIIGMMDITPIPRAPEQIRGVINLRGKIIPIVDLRWIFGMPAVEATAESCIIVVDTGSGPTGAVVDSVSEVLRIPDEAIEQPPALGPETRSDYLLGIGKVEGGVKLLLDIERVLTQGGSLGAEAMRSQPGGPDSCAPPPIGRA